MRLRTVCAHAAALAIASLAGCNGTDRRATDGSRRLGGWQSSGSAGSGTTTGGGATTGTGATTGGCDTGGGATTGAGATAGSGATSGTGATTGAAGSGSGDAPPVDLEGSPKYYRLVRLTNAQWARARPGPPQARRRRRVSSRASRAAVIGTTDFSNNELVLDVKQRSWADFQTAAETLAAQVTATDAALARVYSGTDAARVRSQRSAAAPTAGR